MDKIQQYWDTFSKNHGIEDATWYADGFGLGKEMEDQLAQLVKDGIKTATCSAYELYEEGEHVPQAGDYMVVLDGSKNPICVVETKVTEVVAFNQIMESHAYHEGEMDRSYQSWYEAHVEFFTREYQEMGKEFREDIPCLCEVFEVVE